MDAIRLSKRHVLHSVHDQLQAVETDIFHSRQARAAEEDRSSREYRQHQQDVLAFQAEADRLDREYRAKMDWLDREHRAKMEQFQREEKELLLRIARVGDDVGQV